MLLEPEIASRGMRRIRFIPNIITAFGLSAGLFVIGKVNMVEPGIGIYHTLYVSVILLLAAAFADLLDGAIARVIKAESAFGLNFDSLADAVTFGVAPSVLLLKTLSLEPGTALSFYAMLGSMLYSICGILRLARFNIRALEAREKPDPEQAKKKHFTGLPIPAAALAAVSINLLLASPFGEKYMYLGQEARAILLTTIMIFLGYFMISQWKFPSSKMLFIRLRVFQLLFLTALLAILIFYGFLYFFSLLLTSLSWGYILLGWSLSIARMIAGKTSTALRDFEPDDDED